MEAKARSVYLRPIRGSEVPGDAFIGTESDLISVQSGQGLRTFSLSAPEREASKMSHLPPTNRYRSVTSLNSARRSSVNRTSDSPPVVEGLVSTGPGLTARSGQEHTGRTYRVARSGRRSGEP